MNTKQASKQAGNHHLKEKKLDIPVCITFSKKIYSSHFFNKSDAKFDHFLSICLTEILLIASVATLHLWIHSPFLSSRLGTYLVQPSVNFLLFFPPRSLFLSSFLCFFLSFFPHFYSTQFLLDPTT